MKIQAIKYYESPIGMALITANEGAVVQIETIVKMDNMKPSPYYSEEEFITSDEFGIKHLEGPYEANTQVIKMCQMQLEEYFKGTRKYFDFTYKNIGTPFREKVWKELEKIPYGEIRSYKDIAVAINNEKAVRAVGGANHHNNLWIVVPCHRVIGADGKLTGYGGGVDIKEWLLKHEAKYKQQLARL